MILKTVRLFSEAPEDALTKAASALELVDVEPGETFITRGEIGRSMYIIVSGRVRVHDGDITFNHKVEGAVVGEMAVLDSEPRTASVTATEQTRMLRLDQDALYELLGDHPEVVRGLITQLNRSLRARTAELSALHTRLEQLKSGSPVP